MVYLFKTASKFETIHTVKYALNFGKKQPSEFLCQIRKCDVVTLHELTLMYCVNKDIRIIIFEKIAYCSIDIFWHIYNCLSF